MNPKELKLIRLLIGVIVMILFLFILFISFAIPSVNYFKSANAKHSEVKSRYELVKQDHDESLQLLRQLKSNNSKVIDAFANDFDEELFLRYMNTIFDEVKFQKSKAQEGDSYLHYELQVSTSMQTPMRFYQFLNEVSNYSNILEAQFPIEFEMVDGKLIGSFGLHQYHYEIESK